MTSNMRAIRWGIMGTGGIARIMARAIQSVDGATLSAIASREAARARAFAHEFGAPRWYGDYAALARSADVDVVYVATPPIRHIEDCTLALEEGKHVLCEKPLTAGGQCAEAVVQLAGRKQLFFMEAMWTRFLPAVLEILNNPRVGQIKMLIAGGAFKPQINPDYFLFRPELGGGVMADAGIYLLHLAHWLLGPPHSIAAHLGLGPFGADDHDAVLLDYANQAKALLYVSMRTSQPPYAEILCEHARVRLAAPVFNPTAIEVVFAEGESKTWRFESSQDNYRFQIEEVVACLRNGEFVSPRMPPALSLSVSRILRQIVSSAPSASPSS